MLKNRFQVARGQGLVVLGAVALAGACGSTKTSFGDNPAGGGSGGESGWTFLPPGSGGKTATGGNSTGTGGASAQAGTPGTAGSGGATQVTFKCGGQKPTQPIITSFDGFMADEWASPGNLAGGVYVYPDALKPSAGEFFRLAAEVSTYTGMGVYFNGCVDASKYKGVRFTIYGDPGASGTVRFFPVVNRNRDVSTEFSVGSCIPSDPSDPWLTCHPPEMSLPVTSTPTEHYVPWTAFEGGTPTLLTDGSDVLTLEWAFRWLDGDTAYKGELTVDNVAFYDDEGAGGAGGAGGSTGEGGEPGNEGGAAGLGGQSSH
jgi:hypothetical protein